MLNYKNCHQLICTIAELKTLDEKGLIAQSQVIRDFLIKNISHTGGHIGANLSVVELTLALHYLFDSPKDKIIFDTGHQGYTHKLLTGRQQHFSSLNQYGGLSRFISRNESEHDIIDASHAGTSLSIASGMAVARESDNENYIIPIIGDGSLGEGLAFEGLNYCAALNIDKFIIVINDNEMAIAPPVGGLKDIFVDKKWKEKSRDFFSIMGFDYIPIGKGHHINELLDGFKRAKYCKKPVIVHVKTEKGKGLSCAKHHPYKMHFSMPFNPDTGEGASPSIPGMTYAQVAANTLEACISTDKNIVVLTPATPYASALDTLLKQFPEQVIDVGMAEQHAVAMATGLALNHKKPVVCMQTTFMQRAFDQLVHDVSYMNLPVTLLGTRAGFAGYDGATHHGIFDIPYLRTLPNMQVIYPADSQQLQKILQQRLANPKGPMVILHPYEALPKNEVITENFSTKSLAVVREGRDGFIFTLGNRLPAALSLAESLKQLNKSYGVAVIQSIKPFPVKDFLSVVVGIDDIITLEESLLSGGFGSLILEELSRANLLRRVFRSGIDDTFIEAGDKQECSIASGIMPEQIIEKVLNVWNDYQQPIEETVSMREAAL